MTSSVSVLSHEPPLRVAVIDARRLVREGVAVLIGDEPDLEVCAALSGIASDSDLDTATSAEVIVLGRGVGASGLSGRVVQMRDDQDVSALLTAVRDSVYAASHATVEAQGVAGSLTARELTVLRAVGSGQSAPQIAVALGLSPRTVEGYKQTILATLGVQSQAQAIARAQELGLL